MRRFLYRINYDGFIDWLHDYNKVRNIMNSWKYYNDEVKEWRKEEYNEALVWYKDFLVYKCLLNENEQKYIEAIIRHHTPDWNLSSGLAYEKWKHCVVSKGRYSPKEISNEEVGKALIEAREFRCMTRTQVAGIIGISYNTLKMYETGKRTLPFDVYYKLIQFLDIEI